MADAYKKSGYLNSEFKIFYLTTATSKEFEYHYHDFHKLLIFLSGSVSYSVEGRDYELCPGDIVLIRAGEIHRPVVHENAPYKRIIVYISDDFFSSCQKDGCNLFYCYEESVKQRSNLIRLSPLLSNRLNAVVTDLADSFRQKDPAAALYQKIKFIEYMILLNRMIAEEQIAYLTAGTVHPVVLDIMNFINEHISDDLSIDIIAQSIFLNRSYIMHLFKSETGYTIGKYITEKRLFLANRYISQGMSMTDACYKSGFRNYTTFYQAYKKKYHVSPKSSLAIE
ncbi:MAG: helix-turn-helix domain-containing protein [Clostridiales bacterium]|nr:helix-turn-helix domain-containing protein [Clostridiales bacterium]